MTPAPHSESSPDSITFHTAWTHALASSPRGLALAREKGWVLAWDTQDWLYLLNQAGERQAQIHAPGKLATAACADDGSAYVAAGARGEVWWLAPDLHSRWERSVSHPVIALALDPFGQYLAVADADSNLSVFDCQGKLSARVQSPRSLHHLEFVPTAPFLLTASDYGLAACFDLKGKLIWRDGLVAHIGSLAVSGSGESVILACFTEGLQRYSLGGENLGRQSQTEPCRLAALTFDGCHLLVAGMGAGLQWLDAQYRILSTYTLDQPVVAMRLAPLGDRAVIAVNNGFLFGFDLSRASGHS
jgi:WD40 repeat protein